MLSRPFYNIKIIILDLPHFFTLLIDVHMMLVLHQMSKIIWKQFQDNHFIFIYICNFLFSKKVKWSRVD